MEKLAIDGGQPVRKEKIYYGHQWIHENDIQAVCDVLRSDYLTCGPAVTKFEEDLCETRLLTPDEVDEIEEELQNEQNL